MRATLVAAAALLAASSASAQTYHTGLGLELQPCSGGPTDLQNFQFNGDGSIRHVASGMCVEAWPGSDYGWGAQLQLQNCVAGHLLQQFVPGTNPAGDAIRVNNTVIIGCLAWNVWQGNWNAGDEVGPYYCADPGPAPNEVFIVNSPWSGAIQSVDSSGTPSLCVSVTQPMTPYTLDDTIPGAVGAPWDGLGIIAGEGTARLLFDYPETQRNLILDALFTPGVGLNPQILKIEIGGDGMATMGSEPSHQHYQGEQSQAATRGTQIWLAQQARQRNPNIKIFALPWAWPGWLASAPGDTTPFANPNTAAAYVRDYLMAAQQLGGVTIDYVGIFSDVWDDDTSPGYVKALKTFITGAGLSTKIVCADVNSWKCATLALQDGDLMNAVDVFADHGASVKVGFVVLPLPSLPALVSPPCACVFPCCPAPFPTFPSLQASRATRTPT
jgi:hypothetical protein